MQTPIGEVDVKPEVEVMLWKEVTLLSVTSYPFPEGVVDIRMSRIIAGKRKRQDKVLIVIKFMTSLKKDYDEFSSYTNYGLNELHFRCYNIESFA